jgi:signal transduction histidine kinase
VLPDLSTAAASPGRTGSFQVPLWRAIAVFRFAALAYAGGLALRNLPGYAHPTATVLVLIAMTGWTFVTAYAYRRPDRRRWPLLGADLVVSWGVLAAGPWLIGRAATNAGVPTLSVAWMAAPVLAWAVAGGRRAGVGAALVLGVTDLAVRERINQSSPTGAALMLLAGIAVGHVARLAGEAERRLQRAVELEAATRERERLARDIHDSVLQVLAMVARQGAHLEGEAGRLARLAGEQEAALRMLITTGASSRGGGGSADPPAAPESPHTAWEPHGTTGDRDDYLDLRSVLGRYAAPPVSLAVPAESVYLPAATIQGIAAAVAAALDNVNRHAAGRAWILVEEEPDAVTVSIRDDGPGIAPGRLAAAKRQGRLGVAQSIRGRIAELGGTVQITSIPGEGTEVEIRVPRSGPGTGTGTPRTRRSLSSRHDRTDRRGSDPGDGHR